MCKSLFYGGCWSPTERALLWVAQAVTSHKQHEQTAVFSAALIDSLVMRRTHGVYEALIKDTFSNARTCFLTKFSGTGAYLSFDFV